MAAIYSKRCKRCRQRKLADDFRSNGKPSHPTGISGWKAICKSCEQALEALKKLDAIGK